jgi:chemotaxis protein methyltransferase CheR
VTTPSALEQQVARMLDARIGLKSDPTFRRRLARTLRDLGDARNVEGEQLVGALATDASLLDELLDRVTVQETGFFRHPDHFTALADVILPAASPPWRAWSAASANGQEAYSLAMLFDEAGQSGSVLASDISPGALRRTSEAQYAEREMGGVSPERRRRHFTVAGDRWQAVPALRSRVTVERHNLIHPIPAAVGECQVVMCRNVLIYFSAEHARLFLARLADAMDPAAVLFVGGAETLWQITDRFEPVQIGSCYAYRPQTSAASGGSGLRDVVPARSAPGPVPSPAAGPTPRLAPRPAPAMTPSATPGPATRTPVQASVVTVAAGAVGPTPDETGQDQERLGRRLLAEGAVEEAVVAFRRWAYQCPDDPMAHFHLGVALDHGSGGVAAPRAYRAALAALDRTDPGLLPDLFEGYGPTELRKLLVARSSAAGDGVTP